MIMHRKIKLIICCNIALRGDGSIHPADQSTLQGFADLKRLIVYVTGFEQIDSSFFLSSTFENALLTGVPVVTGLPVIPFQFPPHSVSSLLLVKGGESTDETGMRGDLTVFNQLITSVF